MGGFNMKRKIMIFLLVLFMVVSPIQVSADVASDYKEWLETNRDNGVTYDDLTDMWGVVWDKALPPAEDAQMLPKESSKTGVYKVETLAGTNGSGFKDGTKTTAKINIMGDIVSTKNGDIYFSDADNKAIRRVNAKTSKIETVYKLEDDIRFEGETRIYRYQNAYITKVVYNPYDDSIYYGVAYEAGKDNALSLIVKLDNNHTIISYDKHTKYKAPTVGWMDFIKFEGSKLIYSERFGWKGNPSYILTANISNETEEAAVLATASEDHPEIANMKMLRGRNDVIVNKDYIYIYDTFYREFRKINRTTLESKVIASYNLWMSAIVATKDKFYFADGSTIYEMGLDGKTTAILDNDNFSSPIKNITAINLDMDGNLIVSDTINTNQKGKVINCAIRKIYLSGR
jgi:hypothetical protein